MIYWFTEYFFPAEINSRISSWLGFGESAVISYCSADNLFGAVDRESEVMTFVTGHTEVRATGQPGGEFDWRGAVTGGGERSLPSLPAAQSGFGGRVGVSSVVAGGVNPGPGSQSRWPELTCGLHCNTNHESDDPFSAGSKSSFF